jgi:hypothetical protein
MHDLDMYARHVQDSEICSETQQLSSFLESLASENYVAETAEDIVFLTVIHLSKSKHGLRTHEQCLDKSTEEHT